MTPLNRWQREYVRLVGEYMNETRPIVKQLAVLESYQQFSLLCGPAGDLVSCQTQWAPEAASVRDRLMDCLKLIGDHYRDRIAKLARERLLPPDGHPRSPHDRRLPCSRPHGP